MELELIGKEFFKNPKHAGVPLVTFHKESGVVSFNLAAKTKYELDTFNYLIFARDPKNERKFFIIPTDDLKNGWKITRYKNQVNTYLKICSTQLVELVAKGMWVGKKDQFQCYMHEDGKTEKGWPIFSLSLKNY